MEVPLQTPLYISSLLLPLPLLNVAFTYLGSRYSLQSRWTKHQGNCYFWPEPFFFSLQLCEFVQKDELKPAVTQVLWERATKKVPCSPLERCSSVMLLGMMAR